jgi:hypothetical protein
MTLKGFDTMYDEPEPSPGSYQHARKVWERKKAEEAEAKKAVDKSLLKDDSTIAKTVTIATTATVAEKATLADKAIAPPVAETATVAEPATEDGYVSLENNWMKLDIDSIRVMTRLSVAEFKIYLYFLSLSYGAWEPKNICSVSLSIIADVLGVESTAPVSRCVKSLMQQGFLKRQFKGEAKKDLSIYRVFLPSEIPNVGGKTRLRLLPK